MNDKSYNNVSKKMYRLTRDINLYKYNKNRYKRKEEKLKDWVIKKGEVININHYSSSIMMPKKPPELMMEFTTIDVLGDAPREYIAVGGKVTKELMCSTEEDKSSVEDYLASSWGKRWEVHNWYSNDVEDYKEGWNGKVWLFRNVENTNVNGIVIGRSVFHARRMYDKYYAGGINDADVKIERVNPEIIDEVRKGAMLPITFEIDGEGIKYTYNQ